MIIGTNVAPEDDNLSHGTPTPSGTDGAETFGIPAAYIEMMFGDLSGDRDDDTGETAPGAAADAVAR